MITQTTNYYCKINIIIIIAQKNCQSERLRGVQFLTYISGNQSLECYRAQVELEAGGTVFDKGFVFFLLYFSFEEQNKRNFPVFFLSIYISY